MFGSSFSERMTLQLGKIAETLQRLDTAVHGVDVSMDGAYRLAQQQKAMAEIQQLMKEAKAPQDVQSGVGTLQDYGSSAQYAQQNHALRRIESVCRHLQEAMNDQCAAGAMPETCAKYDEALAEIGQILESVGQHDSYAEDKKDRMVTP